MAVITHALATHEVLKPDDAEQVYDRFEPKPEPTKKKAALKKESKMPNKQEQEDLKSKPLSYWKERLSPEQFKITRKKGTERAYTGEYHDSKKTGTYTCIGCGTEVFSSKSKFDSGTGWPSFWEPVKDENVATQTDRSLFASRIEVLCKNCGAHLGHVFDDGPRPTGLRYCINSVALDFVSDPDS